MDASTSGPLVNGYNQVSGRVFIAETSVGIPNLIVSLFNVAVTSEPTRPPNGESMDTAGGPSEILAHHLGRRIGSVITDSNGLFGIGFGDQEPWSGAAQVRPSLLLLVTGPEVSGSTPCRNLLHASCDIRIEAGRWESYAIAISRAQLEAAGVAVPIVGGKQAGQQVAQAIADASELSATVAAASAKVTKARLATEHDVQEGLEGAVQQAVSSLSLVPTALRNSDRFVTPTQSVHAASRGVIQADLRKIAATVTRTGYVNLTAKQVDSLRDNQGRLPAAIDANVFEPMLHGLENIGEKPATLIRTDPVVVFCKNQTFPGDQCNQADRPTPVPTMLGNPAMTVQGSQRTSRSLAFLPRIFPHTSAGFLEK